MDQCIAPAGKNRWPCERKRGYLLLSDQLLIYCMELKASRVAPGA